MPLAVKKRKTPVLTGPVFPCFRLMGATSPYPFDRACVSGCAPKSALHANRHPLKTSECLLCESVKNCFPILLIPRISGHSKLSIMRKNGQILTKTRCKKRTCCGIMWYEKNLEVPYPPPETVENRRKDCPYCQVHLLQAVQQLSVPVRILRNPAEYPQVTATARIDDACTLTAEESPRQRKGLLRPSC